MMRGFRLSREKWTIRTTSTICRPFSISNPEDRVLFMERTFMCLVSTPLG
jgi:hypothetical protein